MFSFIFTTTLFFVVSGIIIKLYGAETSVTLADVVVNDRSPEILYFSISISKSELKIIASKFAIQYCSISD